MSQQHDIEPSANDNPTQFRLPHSGNIPVEEGGERPVQEFDNTSLEEAYQQGLIRTPNSPADLEPAKKSRKNLLIGFGAGVTALALSAGAYLGLKGGDKPEANPSQPVATAPTTPGQSHSSETSSPAQPSSPETGAKTDLPGFKSSIEIPNGFSIVGYPEGVSPADTQSMTADQLTDKYGAVPASSSTVNPSELVEGWLEQNTLLANTDLSPSEQSNYITSTGFTDDKGYANALMQKVGPAMEKLQGADVGSTREADIHDGIYSAVSRRTTIFVVNKLNHAGIEPYLVANALDKSSIKAGNNGEVSAYIIETDNTNNDQLTKVNQPPVDLPDGTKEAIIFKNVSIKDGHYNFSEVDFVNQ